MMASQWERKAIESGVFIGRVRSLQDAHYRAHYALANWGAWSRDLRRVYPVTVAASPTWREADPSKFGDFADAADLEKAEIVPQTEVKAESAEKEPYDEKSALELDQRLHGYGGLNTEVRRALRVAYVSRETPEDQFPRFAGCSDDGFCERLQEALLFVERFA